METVTGEDMYHVGKRILHNVAVLPPTQQRRIFYSSLLWKHGHLLLTPYEIPQVAMVKQLRSSSRRRDIAIAQTAEIGDCSKRGV